MITNREMFMENLANSSDEEFVDLITCKGKCTRCSNYYWDANNSGCHKNMNNSSCEKGIREFMESDIDENLQLKYAKRYIVFHNHEEATAGKMIAEILYRCGVVDKSDECECRFCAYKDNDECINKRICCKASWINIKIMRDAYTKSLKSELPDFGHDYDKMMIDEKYRDVLVYIEDVLVPKIKSDENKNRISICINYIRESRKMMSKS